jgi:prolipoprotein diacylglyceryltransferase
VFAAYIVLYCIGRFGEELLRIDPAHHIAGLRLNAWVSLIGIAAGAVWYVLSQRADRPARPRRRKEKPAPPGRKMAVPHGKRVRPPG